jgi:hypothetical protein
MVKDSTRLYDQQVPATSTNNLSSLSPLPDKRPLSINWIREYIKLTCFLPSSRDRTIKIWDTISESFYQMPEIVSNM